MPTKIIDIHQHIISDDIKHYPINPIGGKLSDWAYDRPVTFEQMITAMDQAKVDKAAIVHSSTTYGYDNSYVADCVNLQPNKQFVGVFSVDMLAGDAAEKIRYWAGRGLHGLRVFTAGRNMQNQTTWLDDSRTFKGWASAGELGIPVCVQLHQKGVEQLKVPVKRFPNIRIVIDHLMRPPIGEGPPYDSSSSLFDLARYENVYLKLTSYNIEASTMGKATPETFFSRLVNTFGASRIAWGSNYSSSKGTLSELLEKAKAVLSVLPQIDQEWIFYRTAQVLYPSLADI